MGSSCPVPPPVAPPVRVPATTDELAQRFHFILYLHLLSYTDTLVQYLHLDL